MPTIGVIDYYSAINLVSNVPGAALIQDPNLVNPWGINFPQKPGIDPPVYVADQGAGLVSAYQIEGNTVTMPNSMPTSQPFPFPVQIPTSGSTEPSGPTGLVQNTHAGEFLIPGPDGPVSASYIFDTLQGTIGGYALDANGNLITNPAVIVPNTSSPGAEYTGLANGTVNGNDYIYAANEGTNPGIQVFDSSFIKVNFADKNDPSPFIDPKLPAGFMPYGVHEVPLGTQQVPCLVVTYRSPNFQGGAVAVFREDGTFLGQIASDTAASDGTVGTVLQSPWGLAVINQSFGGFSADDLFVGNFSSGQIDAYDVSITTVNQIPIEASGQFAGQLLNKDFSALTIPGLRDIHFGPGLGSVPGNTVATLLFTAGNDKSGDGNVSLYGEIYPTAVQHSLPHGGGFPGSPGGGNPKQDIVFGIGGADGGAASGNGGAGHGGGGGNQAQGSGLYLASGVSDTWVLSDDIISFNPAAAGNGGNGGSKDPETGAGVFDIFTGTLEIVSSLIVNNTAQDGVGGSGSGSGSSGYAFPSVGGGLAVEGGGPVSWTPDTVILFNSADSDPKRGQLIARHALSEHRQDR